MQVKKLYRYIGYNGTVTTPILLPNIDKLEVLELIASNEKVLTNGDRQVQSIIVLPEDQSSWTEIDDPQAIVK